MSSVMSSVMSAGRDVELLRALIERVDQQDPGAFNNLGVLYHSRGLHAEAVDAFLRALAIDPRMRTAARDMLPRTWCSSAPIDSNTCVER